MPDDLGIPTAPYALMGRLESSPAFEILDGPLMFLCCRSCIECAQIFTLACFFIYLS